MRHHTEPYSYCFHQNTYHSYYCKVHRDFLAGRVLGGEIGNLVDIIAQTKIAVFRAQAQADVEAGLITHFVTPIIGDADIYKRRKGLPRRGGSALAESERWCKEHRQNRQRLLQLRPAILDVYWR